MIKKNYGQYFGCPNFLKLLYNIISHLIIILSYVTLNYRINYCLILNYTTSLKTKLNLKKRNDFIFSTQVHIKNDFIFGVFIITIFIKILLYAFVSHFFNDIYNDFSKDSLNLSNPPPFFFIII